MVDVTRLPYRPGFWLVHTHDEHEPCDLSLGGCHYCPGMWRRIARAVTRVVRGPAPP